MRAAAADVYMKRGLRIVCMYVCLCVGHIRVPCKKSGIDRLPFGGGAAARGPKERCVSWGYTRATPGEYD